MSRDENKQMITSYADDMNNSKYAQSYSRPQISPAIVGLFQTTRAAHTHFPHKVCTVEFAVVLFGLHRLVWKFPLLPKRGSKKSVPWQRAATFHQRNTQHCTLTTTHLWLQTVMEKLLSVKTRWVRETGVLILEARLKSMQTQTKSEVEDYT